MPRRNKTNKYRNETKEQRMKRHQGYIVNNSKHIYQYPRNIKYEQDPLNTDVYQFKHYPSFKFQHVNIPLEKKPATFCKIVEIHLSFDEKTRGKHQMTLHRWLNVNVFLYNDTIDFLHTIEGRLPSGINLRKLMKPTINYYYGVSKPYESASEDTRIQMHVLDETVDEALKDFKETKKRIDRINNNRKEGEPIRPVVVKHRKINNRKKVMHLELQVLKSPGFRGLIRKATLNGESFDLNTIKKTCVFQKNKKRYFLHVSFHDQKKIEKNNVVRRGKDISVIKVENKDSKAKEMIQNQFVSLAVRMGEKSENYLVPTQMIRNNFISLDPGIRKPLMGYSDTGVYKLGEESKEKMKKYVRREKQLKDIIKEEKKDYNLNKKKKLRKLKKSIKMCKRRQANVITDFHNKIAKYLAERNENVIMGDINTRSLCSSQAGMSPFNKTLLKKLRFSELKKKLKDKCNQYGSGFILINECNTSKLCSNCGNANSELGKSEVYKCEKCKMVIDRDLNGCINILIRYYAEEC